MDATQQDEKWFIHIVKIAWADLEQDMLINDYQL